MKLKLALQRLAQQALRRLPIDLDDPTLDDKVRLLEQRLRAVERKLLVRSVSKVRAPTEQELLLTVMGALLNDDQREWLDHHRPGWRSTMQEIDAVAKAFRESGGFYHQHGEGPFPRVIPVRRA